MQDLSIRSVMFAVRISHTGDTADRLVSQLHQGMMGFQFQASPCRKCDGHRDIRRPVDEYCPRFLQYPAFTTSLLNSVVPLSFSHFHQSELSYHTRGQSCLDTIDRSVHIQGILRTSLLVRPSCYIKQGFSPSSATSEAWCLLRR